jgi:hypothetical protein
MAVNDEWVECRGQQSVLKIPYQYMLGWTDHKKLKDSYNLNICQMKIIH